ncbi:MarR family winged helix-turn-helix transcriptional regulator [Kribbella shirazensis]|uniref:DNA-binding MarR family transcriptional regulator/GNAT superfamily N-acetyltransferase n=1 Tax=Kribbella shirazensis TaxID=1105143 RepID=A0A7X6A048_9ACTN|nr:MarR family winged helix-turn-helix transcriptional regulator [Kribbella shirazensis]NIK55804.1 DNA-binding MarR family transcriptional regulator/GNAT superfamily N-acetyltransferase [Kribbella shirazensis]
MGVAEVRRFNRVVTQRVGALHDAYLSRGRPLGQDRVLWEIGPNGCDVRSLRARLDLDSGYVSRLLRSLETAGLVRVEPSEDDGRVRIARLTADGLAERQVLDERSDELAESILEPLDGRQRKRLVAAMDEVARLLTASMVRVDAVDPRLPAAQYCLESYFAELGERFEAGFDRSRSISADNAELTPPAGLLLMATLHAEPVGCGALKFHGTDPAEIKRMWVATDARGLGLGRRLLTELERAAAAHGAPAVRLETNRNLTEAIALYRSAGYQDVPPFNTEPYAHHWFEKRL